MGFSHLCVLSFSGKLNRSPVKREPAARAEALLSKVCLFCHTYPAPFFFFSFPFSELNREIIINSVGGNKPICHHHHHYNLLFDTENNDCSKGEMRKF